MERKMYPVYVQQEEIADIPDRDPILPSFVERSSMQGLCCSFCGRYHKTFGDSGVDQVDVSATGKVNRRFYGGESALRCWRCKALDIRINQEGKYLIDFRAEFPKDRIRDQIADEYIASLLEEYKQSLWQGWKP